VTVRPLPLELGALLAGKYRIDALLGQGGMGAVFAAENLDLGRQVAIKVLYGDLARDESLAKRFRQEARAAAAIGHPGIVDVLDLGTTEDGAAFIVMERLDGETLGARILRMGRLPASMAVTLVAEALEALAAAHAKGIVHRDLKPDNIFLVTKPVPAVKLVDFGISKLQGAEDVGITTTGMVMGTPLYMSPEQARGHRDIGQATDLYAMGAILYTALCGEPPLSGSSYNELIAKLVTEEPARLETRRRGLPAPLVELVHGLLDKDPSVRPHARDTADRLRAMHAQLGAQAEQQMGYSPTAPPDADRVAPPPSAAASRVALEETTASSPPRPAIAIASTVAADPTTPPPRARPFALIGILLALAAIAAVVVFFVTRKDPAADPKAITLPRDAAIAPTVLSEAGPPGPAESKDSGAAPVIVDAAPAPPIDARPSGGTKPPKPPKKLDAGPGSGTGTSTGTGLEIDTENPLGK